MPDFEPQSPLRHFRMVGRADFHQADAVIPQQAELWLADTDRMRIRLGVEGQAPNIFLLFDPETAWVRTAGAEFRPYPSLDLWKETLVRWQVLRFPWGWEDVIGTEAELERSFLLETELGPLTLETDPQGLPLYVSLRETNLSLGDWKLGEDGQRKVPHRWDWTSENGRRVETFDTSQAQALFLDSAFRPEVRKDLSFDAHDAEDVLMAGEHFDVVEVELQFLDETQWASGEDWAPGRWWVGEEQRVYLFAVGVDPQEEAQRLPLRPYLWWSTLRDLDPQAALEQMLAALPQLGYLPDGALWVLEPDSDRTKGQDWRRGYLLPVRRP